MNKYVLDSSALLAVIQEEPGTAAVEKILNLSVMSSVNLCEVIGKLALDNISVTSIRSILKNLVRDIIPFDDTLAVMAGRMAPYTKKFRLSLGDRACLATAHKLHMEAVTSDKIWAKLQLPVKIKVIR